MNDQVTRTTSTSWFSRIGGAFSGVLIGIVLIFVCVAVLFWNEGRAVKTERGLKEGAAMVTSVGSETVDPANDQKLVHVSGPVAVTAPLTDPAFGVSGTGVRLARQVEMYQWRETSKSETRTKLGGGEETVTTYSYAPVWSGTAENSDGFAEPNGHRNPEFDVEAADFLAEDATLGAFQLGEDVVGQIDGGADMTLSPDLLPAVREAVGSLRRHVAIVQNRIVLSDRPLADVDASEAAGAGQAAAVAPSAPSAPSAPAGPAIGDLRVTYALTPAAETSVVARQTGDGFAPYRARNGEEFLLVASGDVPAAEMFEGAQNANRILTWIVRAIGLMVLIAGFGMILAPLGVLADVLPLAGTIVRMGTGLIGFVLGLTVGTITIALAWFTFRPLLTAGILIVGCGIAFMVYRFGRARARKKVAAEAAAAPAV